MWIDGLAVGHLTGKVRRIGTWKVVDARMWDENAPTRGHTDQDHGHRAVRWTGLPYACFPQNHEWTLGDSTFRVEELTIQILTRQRVNNKMQPPPSQQYWESKFGPIDWYKVWRIKSPYCSPRDEVTWLKLQHRNLYVAKSDPNIPHPTCNAQGCSQEESMAHLAECQIIKREFWNRVKGLMQLLEMRVGHRTEFLILGKIGRGVYVDREEAGILFIAWRCLYAECVRARIEDKRLNLKRAYACTIRLLVSRIKAYGQKWYRWYSRTRGLRQSKVKQVPKKHRKKKLIEIEGDAKYKINTTLLQEYEKIKTEV